LVYDKFVTAPLTKLPTGSLDAATKLKAALAHVRDQRRRRRWEG